MIEMLDQHRAFQEAEELVKGRQWHNDHDLIFTSTIGTPLDPEQFGKTVPKIAIEAGLGHWSIHELRHSCASIMIAMDVPLEVIAEQLGHASIRVTKDVYGHLMPRSRARAAAAMQAALFDENVHSRPQQTDPLATQLATFDADFITPKPVTRGFVGRPGLDPGTLGPKREVHRRSRESIRPGQGLAISADVHGSPPRITPLATPHSAFGGDEGGFRPGGS